MGWSSLLMRLSSAERDERLSQSGTCLRSSHAYEEQMSGG